MADENIRTTMQFQADITDFKAAMQEANRAVKLANSEFKAVSSGMDDWSGSTDGLAAKLRQLGDVHDAEKRKLDVLQAAYEQTVAEQGAASAAAVDLQTKINNQQAVVNKAQKEIDTYTDKLEELKKSADGAASDLGKLGDAAKETGDDAKEGADGWSIMKDVIAGFVSDTINWAIESFKELMTAGDDALATLGARTGATTEQMAKYKDVMNEIYRNNFGESFEDVADAMGQVVQMFGDMDNASLQNITEKAITLRDTFDMDYKESLRAVNSLMDQFGITADEAFNLIAQGAQQGLNQNDDLLDTINEYSMQFKTAGYSADDMFNMLKNGAESGTWSVDKLGDAVKEFNIRAKDGTIAEALVTYKDQLGLTDEQVKKLTADMEAGGARGQDAYNTILGALGNVSSETDRYQAGVSIFGTMWEDLGETTVQSLMKTEGGITSTKAAMEELANTKYDTLSSALSGLGRVIQSDLLQPLADTIAPLVKGLVEWVIENMPVIGPIIAGIATALGVLAAALAIQGIINGVTTAFALLNTVLLANPIALVVAAIAGIVAAFVVLWNKCDAFRNFWLNMWEGIKKAFSSVTSWLTKTMQNTIKIFSDAWRKAGEWLVKTITNIVTSFQNAWAKIKNAWGKVGEWFSGIWSKITGVFSGAASWFGNIFRTAWQGITNAFSNVSSFFSGIWSKIKSVFSVDGMLSIGKNLVSGLWNGISNSFQWIKDKISGWVGNVMSFIKGLFGIKSPSRVMRDEVGKMLGLGMAEGIEESRNAVNGAVRKLGDAALGGLSAAGGGASTSAAPGRAISFTQINNSPRALSRREIYRQTNNLLAFAGGVK